MRVINAAPMTVAVTLLSAGCLSATAPVSDQAAGVQAFEQRRWPEAIGAFLRVLRSDPRNGEAREYLNLAIQQMETERRARLHDRRLQLLGEASRKLDRGRLDATVLQTAITESTQAETSAREERWHAQCLMAAAEARRGRLAAANDLVLRVLAEESGYAEAQRLLSDLQSQIREALDFGRELTAIDRAVLEGFYGFGQADYRTAVTAWQRARSLLGQAYGREEAVSRAAGFRFDTHEQVAKAKVEEEEQKAREKTLFAQGVALYEQQSYARALEAFRRLALENPGYPELAGHLVQSETALERERTRHLSRQKRERAAESLERGLAALERGAWTEANGAFKQALLHDPTNPQAKSYLEVAESEQHRACDPLAAQNHYEAGLVRYASGKLEEALREWRIASRLDPSNTRAAKALVKVEREIAMNRDVPE